jgi:6-phosphogluconolactonase
MKLKIYPDFETLTKAAVEEAIRLSEEAIHQRGRFTIALSGGSTPAPFYRALAKSTNRKRLDWEHIHLFWGDERPVPADHPDSNYRMAKETLIDLVGIPEANVHRVPAELDVRLAAFSYEEVLRDFFDGDWPPFDLTLLGMGADGHTASLFPHSAGLNEAQRWFIANYAPGMETWRLTLTRHAINAARTVWVLVRGESKAEKLAGVLAGPQNPQANPIQLIHPEEGEMVWWVDQAAAQKLPEGFVLK